MLLNLRLRKRGFDILLLFFLSIMQIILHNYLDIHSKLENFFEIYLKINVNCAIYILIHIYHVYYVNNVLNPI